MKTPTKNLIVGFTTAMVLGISSIAFAALDPNSDPKMAEWSARRESATSSSMNVTASAAGTGVDCPLCKWQKGIAEQKLADAAASDISGAEGRRGQ